MSTTKTPPRDRFDCLCDCVLIDCPPADQARFGPQRDPQHYQAFKRQAVNAGVRDISADGDCPVCNGSGYVHDPETIETA